MTDEQKDTITEYARICEMRLRMSNGSRCADESIDWSKVDRDIAARSSEAAFRIAHGA